MQKILPLTVVAAMFLLSVPGLSQTSANLRVGARARVVTDSGAKHIGLIASVTTDSISLARNRSDATPLALPRSRISRLQVSTGRNRGKGVLLKSLIGLGAGVAGGTALGWLTHNDSPRCDFFCDRGSSAAAAGVLGGAAGLVIGTVVGARNGWESWSDVMPSTTSGSPPSSRR